MRHDMLTCDYTWDLASLTLQTRSHVASPLVRDLTPDTDTAHLSSAQGVTLCHTVARDGVIRDTDCSLSLTDLRHTTVL